MKIWQFKLDQERNEVAYFPNSFQVLVVDVAKLIFLYQSCEYVERKVRLLSMIEQALHKEVHSLNITNRCVELAIVDKAFSQIVFRDIISQVGSSEYVLHDLLSLNLKLLVYAIHFGYLKVKLFELEDLLVKIIKLLL